MFEFLTIGTVLLCLLGVVVGIIFGFLPGLSATMGVALMGIGFGLGMNPAITAGAIISGAYFGDKMSPLSDTTNLAPAMSGTDVMTHVRFMLPSTAITYGISAVVFLVMGLMQNQGGEADMSGVTTLSDALKDMFVINPLLLLPPLVVIVAVALKVPAIPGLFRLTYVRNFGAAFSMLVMLLIICDVCGIRVQ